ncbi:MAG: hypothetical protein H7138_16890 [Myxococcales bacterium]|nr:hypothetical protein [Myxococcales bacterium]
MKSLPLIAGLGLGLGLGLSSGHAFADTGNLLQCIDRGFALQKCQLRDLKLSDHLVEDGQIYEGQFLVRYDFPCTGHSVQLGVTSGDSTKSFVMGAANALITLNGTGELHPYDPTPAVTRSLTFRPGCSLNVTHVQLLPSTITAQIWTLQAQSQAHVLDLSVDRYLIAQDFENLSSWNVSKLTLLKDKLELLVAGTPSNLNYRVMLNSVSSALANQPPSATLDELREAGQDVIATLRAELDDEIAIAQALLDRFLRWELAANQALALALDNAAAQND